MQFFLYNYNSELAADDLRNL